MLGVWTRVQPRGLTQTVVVDDANLLSLIASAILERPTCLLCLTTKADEPMPLVVRAVDRIGKTATVSRRQQ
jgi:hypothetical protein